MRPSTTLPRTRASSFGHDVLLMLGARGLGLLVASAQAIVVARELGPTGRGQIAVALSLTLVLVQIGNLGLGSANPYFAAREADIVPRLVTVSLWLALLLGAGLIGLGVLTRVALPDLVHGVSDLDLGLALAAGPFMLLSAFLQSILLGEGRTFVYNAGDLALAIGLFAAIVVGLIWLKIGVAGVLGLTAIRFALSSALYFGDLVRRHAFVTRGPERALAIEMLKYGARVYGASLLSFLVIRADVLLVNGYLGVTQAGLYTAAVTIGDALYVVPTAFAINLFPRAARGMPIQASAQVFRGVVVIYGALCLAFVPLAGPAVHIIYGAKFHESVSLFYWLLPGTFSLGLLNVLAYHLAGRGFPIQLVVVWAVGLAINVAINVVFLPTAGTYIASLSSSIAYALLFLMHARLFIREGTSFSSLIPRARDVSTSARMIGRLLRPARGN